MKNRKGKLLIFDMDGTLYRFKEGSFEKSKLNKVILINAEKFIAENVREDKSPSIILKEIKKDYGEDISIALEERYNIDRYTYFKKVWDINPKNFITKNVKLIEVLRDLKSKYQMAVVSDAPLVWIENVLKELEIKEFFDGRIFSGEGDKRKEHFVFEDIIKSLEANPGDCFVIGDQEKTDVIPAHKLGAKTIYINSHRESKIANYSIKSILDITKIIK